MCLVETQNRLLRPCDLLVTPDTGQIPHDMANISMTETLCPCGTNLPYAGCCGRFHSGQPAPTAEALMRSRYSAFALRDAAYLARTHADARVLLTTFSDTLASALHTKLKRLLAHEPHTARTWRLTEAGVEAMKGEER